MPPEELIRIRRLIASLDELESLIVGSDREQLNHDLRTLKAIVHSLIEIGEGSSRLSLATRQLMPEIPWPQIVHMRNVLVHVYWGVDLDKIWSAATIHAPMLRTRLMEIDSEQEI